MRFKPLFKIVLFLIAIVILFQITGCDALRLQPTEAQKQAAFGTLQTALAVDGQGAQPGSPATKQLVNGTSANLTYIGIPANPSTDLLATTIQAQNDAALRPEIEDVWAGFDTALAAGLIIAGAVTGAGGLKAVGYIKKAQETSAALKEVVKGNEVFKGSDIPDEKAIHTMRIAQRSTQSQATQKLVTEIKNS